jgi:hypothetical protein
MERGMWVEGIKGAVKIRVCTRIRDQRKVIISPRKGVWK